MKSQKLCRKQDISIDGSGIYSSQNRDEMVESGEISLEEDGFMKGYEESIDELPFEEYAEQAVYLLDEE